MDFQPIYLKVMYKIHISYARVSTDDQPLNLQNDALIQVGCVKLFIWRWDRLSRSLKDLIELITLHRGSETDDNISLK